MTFFRLGKFEYAADARKIRCAAAHWLQSDGNARHLVVMRKPVSCQSHQFVVAGVVHRRVARYVQSDRRSVLLRVMLEVGYAGMAADYQNFFHADQPIADFAKEFVFGAFVAFVLTPQMQVGVDLLLMRMFGAELHILAQWWSTKTTAW